MTPVLECMGLLKTKPTGLSVGFFLLLMGWTTVSCSSKKEENFPEEAEESSVPVVPGDAVLSSTGGRQQSHGVSAITSGSSDSAQGAPGAFPAPAPPAGPVPSPLQLPISTSTETTPASSLPISPVPSPEITPSPSPPLSPVPSPEINPSPSPPLSPAPGPQPSPSPSPSPSPPTSPAPSPQPSPAYYSIGGTITGLGVGKSLVIKDQDGVPLTVSANGGFTFTNPLPMGKAYTISIQTRPLRQGCTIDNAAGVVQGTVTNIAVICRDSLTNQVGHAGVEALGLTVSKDGSSHFYVGAYSTGDVDGALPIQANIYFTSTTKYDGNGTKIWRSQQAARSLTSTSYAGGFSAADPSGNVYSVGTTLDSLDGNTMIGVYNFYVVKYSPNGEKQWLRQLGHAQTFFGVYPYVRPTSLAVDGQGNVLVCGMAYGGLDGNTATSIEASTFVTKYDSNGNKQWTRQFPGLVSNYGFGIAFEPTGQIIVAGSTRGTLNSVPLAGTEDGYIMRLDQQGQHLWTRTIGAAGGLTVPKSLALDAQGNILIAGYTQVSLTGNVRKGSTDVFVAKYDGLGARLWVKQKGVAGASTTQGRVTVDTAENVYVIGTTTGALDDNVLTGTQDFFVTKYDPSGTNLWTRQMGASGKSSTSSSIIVLDEGHMILVGYTAGNLDGNALKGIGDIFVTHLWE